MTIWLLRADASHRVRVLPLWQTVFGDAPDMISAFFDSAPFEKTCFLAVAGDTLAGMLFSLPAVLTVDGIPYESRYVYAVATSPAFRGNGVMTALHAFACEEAEKEGAVCMALVPAEETLFSMYRKLGYRTTFFKSRMQLPLILSPEASLSPCGLSDFLAYRRQLLLSHSVSFELYPSMCAFRYDDFLKSGGAIFLADTAFGRGYLAAEQKDGELIIRETTLAGESLSHAAGALCQKWGLSRIFVESTGGKSVPFGMTKVLCKEKGRKVPVKIDGYMNLMLN